MYERVVSVKGFDWKDEMKAYVLPYTDNNVADATAVIPRDEPSEPPANPDDDVSDVIFGGLEERTRRLFRTETNPDTHHLMNSGFVVDVDGWMDFED